jgi:methionyl aminopeptidase
MHFRPKTVQVKTAREIEIMREAGRLAAETLVAVADIVRAGITTEDINTFVHEDTLRRGCKPAPLNYMGFPKSVCTSVNEVVCHGIPGPQKLVDGDIINIDVTHIYQGYHGDTSATFYVGTPSERAKWVTEIARRCLDLAIQEVKPGARLGDIGAAIQEFAEPRGCSVVTDFVGHGIGRKFHEEPKVLHVGTRGRGIRLKPGMTFTIEPMINLGVPDVEVLDDEWTAITADGQLSAQFEHTLLVTETGADLLTARAAPLKSSEIFSDYWASATPPPRS